MVRIMRMGASFTPTLLIYALASALLLTAAVVCAGQHTDARSLCVYSLLELLFASTGHNETRERERI